MTNLHTYYEILEIPAGASPEEVKRAYRKLVKQWHPDQFAGFPEKQEQAEEQIKRINEAYEYLKARSQTSGPPSPSASDQKQQNLALSRLYYQQGVEKAKHEQYREALVDFKQAIFLDADYIEAYKYRGFVYSILGRDQEANADLRKVAQLRQKTGQSSAYSATPRANQAGSVTPRDEQAQWVCAGTLRLHDDVVSAIALSPDGYTFVSGSFDETLRLWQLSTGQQLRRIDSRCGRVYCVAVSPDGRYIASGGEDTTIRLWDLHTGREVQAFGRWLRKGHRDTVLSLAFHPDGKRLVSGGADQTVRLWHLQSGRELYKIDAYSNVVTGVDVSPDGQIIATVGQEKIVKLRYLMNGRLLRAVRKEFKSLAVAFSPTGRYFVTADSDDLLRVWGCDRAQERQLLRGHENQVCAVAWSEDEKRLVSGSLDRTIRVWNSQTGQLLDTLEGHEDSVLSVGFNPEGRTIVSGSADHTIKIWWFKQ
ncbi:DnaJ domain-containing protein [Spirulina subsalsa]|uniref:WD40 domain-containing protein n=1 Tax=Spirulina subsalsa TaxID=54311 RepID=UPI00031A08ED|nr:DnaJ domain-containing protein [Spirulina subsalsa]